MRRELKEAGLQNPVLTERNDIRGQKRRVSKHIIAKPVTNNSFLVDVAGIGGRNTLLPEEIFIL